MIGPPLQRKLRLVREVAPDAFVTVTVTVR
jgi:hypothetical protein